MALQRHLLPLFILWVFSSCFYRSLQEDPFSSFIDETSGYDHRAYPTYFGIINDQEGELEHRFARFNEYDPENLSYEILAKVGSPSTSAQVFNVDDYGAKADGGDDSEAFKKAWKAACSSSSASTLVVPQDKSYLLKPVTFWGPCKSDVTVTISGTIEASANQLDYKNDRRHWLIFENIKNLLVEGGGTINGNGKTWWQSSCKINKTLPCKKAPTAVTFYNCNNLGLKNMRIKDAQQIHVSFEKCSNVQASNLMITAPEKSPNTDGIHITNTQNIQIKSSVIGTGDDCMSIESGSRTVEATDITCGPGHGISIGSLGDDNSEAHVSDVVVNRAKLSGTTNGVRIKTWQGGSGSASNIKFQNVAMNNVFNPIIIDQNYCDRAEPCKEQKSAVQVRDVVYKNIKGTSASSIAINFNCSKTYPCSAILLQDISLVREGGTAKALCNNVKLTKVGTVSPSCS
ncbi:PREDICTED: polygalacturonase [Nelumbo nucifera]|uniref:endo-polygalacturonase n=1 Tax=Nelumbo nucifera TaxID=4432 RepID=A0A1U7ZUB7_NELNU|nr:PREDICTED: polygalacturonase [Nelumbo nucifera]